ncbi:MAG TPA: substrate-binding domain-containing protein [Pirellulales bacterium]|nr:substrate-binding domain-containing protein [Pirellulales bacterium]
MKNPVDGHRRKRRLSTAVDRAAKKPPHDGDANRLFRIGLVFGYGLGFYRDILHGIKAFAADRPQWIFTPIAPDRRALESPPVKEQDGFIAHIFTEPLAKALQRLRRPVVNVSGVLPELPFPRVIVDHEAVGRMAAQHLLQRGVRRFAFVGFPYHAFSLGREAGFVGEIERAGYQAAAFHDRMQKLGDPTGQWPWNESLLIWLKSLEKPLGLFASNDSQGVQLSEYCRHLGLKVPDEVAIVGVDDDDLLCDLARPSLSSVALPGERIGHEAARMLEQILADERLSEPRLVLPPVRVVVRASSDIQALPDADVAAAVRYIRDHADEPIDVRDLLAAVPVSRRSLERRFRRHLQRGIWEEIRRAHLERAKMLLADTDLPMSVVAQRSGFTDSRQLSIAFRQATGGTPTEFRQQHRSRG